MKKKQILINKFAIEIAKEYGYEKNNLKELIKNLNGKIKFKKLIKEKSKLIKTKKSFIIKINKDLSVKEIDFTIAHELGHLFLHMGYIVDKELWNKYMEKSFKSKNSIEEYEADEFAGALLMPKNLYEDALDFFKEEYEGTTIVNITKLAKYFNVSESIVKIRGRNLGYFKY